MVAGLTAGALQVPAATASANDLHQSPPIKWDATGYADSDCPELGAGEVFWHFVQTQTDQDTGKLTATFASAGVITVDSYKHSGGVLHWGITTGQDTLTAASSNIS